MASMWDLRKEAVCRLTCPAGSGSGCHYGGGWILTNSHVVGRNAENVASLTVHFTSGRVQLVVPPQRRHTYFINVEYHINGAVDLQHADVAVFRLTEDEMKLAEFQDGLDVLPSMTHASIGAVNPFRPPRAVQVNDVLRCFHHAGNSAAVLDSVSEPVIDILNPLFDQDFNSAVVHMPPRIAVRQLGNTAAGSSGAPVFDAATGMLVGIHFAGSVSNALAVCFIPTVQHFMKNIVSLIGGCNRLADYHRIAAVNPTPDIAQAIEDLKNTILANLPPFVSIRYAP